ncbi:MULTISPECIES: type II secretion system secretin GspD [unclassified Ensifer]|uniref:type II secretion system secretin GspD n=1 Tax=unclassified Ensifer TaxID=2633371 RepID=UPI00070A2FDB|nr:MULTISPECIES: type II secretion system secretin GspD [unclassified Ensifer]KQW43179.1 type II secretion system protein GspD [Ensifer sp. Root1252]KRC67117.1 type II secretion system protein GspD [Ensifer sp. Root231]KRC93696.1 type II secretion system protein GspD [Ensifer sp. Root258]
MKPALYLALLSAVALSSCTSDDAVTDVLSVKMSQLDSHGKPLPTSHGGTTRIGRDGSGQAFTGAVSPGTGSFVGYDAPISVGEMANGGEGYSLNLVDAPIAAAAKSVLGDTLSVSYVVDPRVTGTVTLQTSSPVSREALIDIFESALSVNAAVIVKRGGNYQIVPSSEAFSSTPSVSVPSMSPKGPGVKVQVVELKYISAQEMKGILEPISRQGSILRVDDTRNLIMLAGTSNDLASLRDAINVFDVDWMKGMSVALHPLNASQPAAVAKELDSIFANDNGAGNKIIKFLPNERLKSILVITSRPAYLSRAATWIAKLDKLASTNEEQLFVYNIQNRPAKELAQVLQAVVSSQSRGGELDAGANTVAPDMQVATVGNVASSFSPDGQSATGGQPLESEGWSGEPMAAAAKSTKTSIVADTENNSLLISTTAREYDHIQMLLRQLDVVPTQVLLEAVIAEVTLTDELKFGLRWFFETGNFGIGLSDLASGAVGASFPGFSWSYATNDIRVTLNALSSVTDVNVVSAPTLMALNNQKATLQVGDQVPIVTQQATSTDGNSPIVNSIELKDTGVILSVTPRVNSSGRIMLDIQQEVSDVVKTTSSGIDSPTIQQRKISTRVIVSDSETIALGGLIQQKNSIGRSQVPVLGDIPLIGNAFKNKTDLIKKTELIIFIKPRVVRDVQQARDVTEEFRQQLDFGSAIPKRRGGTKLQQDLKRLAY